MLGAAWNPAGGVRYHLRARRHRARLWAGFRTELADWLSAWQPSARNLVVVGPSAGHCLPLDWLARFERLTFFEPDPIARFILAHRLRALPGARAVHWIAADRWGAQLLVAPVPPLPSDTSETALLFSNFLGQLTFLVPEPDWAEFCRVWQAQVWPLLAQLPWASFHDRLSGPIAPSLALRGSRSRRASDEESLALYAAHASGELLDHQTEVLLPAAQTYAYFHWPLLPDQHHLIEGVIGRH